MTGVPAGRLVGTPIPQPDDACPVLALDVSVAQIVILHRDGEAAHPGAGGGWFAQHPALEHPIAFQTEVVMMGAGEVLLHHEPKPVPLMSGRGIPRGR